MSTEYYPSVGQKVTFIEVQAGKVNIHEASVNAIAPGEVSLDLTEDVSLRDRALVSLNYIFGGHQWRAKAIVQSAASGSVKVTLRGNPSRGESRDFIRAQLDMKTAFAPLQGTSIDEAQAEMDRIGMGLDSPDLQELSVNLSGNGIAFDWDTITQKGRYVAAYLVLSKSSGDELFTAVGKVVRAVKRNAVCEVALHFENLPEEEQDRLFDYVSAWYHAKIHMALSNLSG